jgi:hypothetical protein
MSEPVVDKSVSALKEGFKTFSSSVRQWLEKVTSVIGIDHTPEMMFVTVLLAMLVIHFVLYVSENNTNLQKSTATHRVFWEMRTYIQTVVVKNYLYWGVFLVGAIVGSTTNLASPSEFYGVATKYGGLLIMLLVLNKVCTYLVLSENAKSLQGSFGPGANYLDTTGPAISLHATPLLPAGKSGLVRAARVVTLWLQAVTDIVLQTFPTSFFFGLVTAQVFHTGVDSYAA